MSAVKTAVVSLIEKLPLGRKGLEGYRHWRSTKKTAKRDVVTDKSWRLFNVELTIRCPFKCVMCARTNNMTREEGLMSLEDFKLAAGQFVAANPAAAATEV